MKRYNAAFANDLLLILASKRIERVVLAGVRTSYIACPFLSEAV